MSDILLDFIFCAENKFRKSLNKFDPRMSKFRLCRWLCQGDVFVLVLHSDNTYNDFPNNDFAYNGNACNTRCGRVT